jgi:hypothetical protein
MSKQNIVLYKRTGAKDGLGNVERQALFSISEGDKDFDTASIQLSVRIGEIHRQAILSGAGVPQIDVVAERRAANDAGQVIKAEYMPLDLMSFKPLVTVPFTSLADMDKAAPAPAPVAAPAPAAAPAVVANQPADAATLGITS